MPASLPKTSRASQEEDARGPIDWISFNRDPSVVFYRHGRVGRGGGGGGGEEAWSGPFACVGLMGSFPVSPRLAHVREAPASTWLNLAGVVATELQFIGWALVGRFIREILVKTT